ncbi:cytochrome P450 71D7-like [Nicotiana tomentosiformis]|uniref:cytochrome P450 71D7-like n=1 Tax=Nicotiana tomentosiformis TaxID=4098 RepID=UPI00388C99EA
MDKFHYLRRSTNPKSRWQKIQIKKHAKMSDKVFQNQIGRKNFIVEALNCDIFIAGSETSSTTIIWALSEMMKNPNIMAKAQSEVRQVFKGKRNDEEDLEKLTYLDLVIKETLRLHTPVPLLPRECREQTDIDGYTIPLRTRVLVNAWALARDPESWNDPECFIPERFENSLIDYMGKFFEFIPFGAGRRACPGMQFGLANVRHALAQLLHHFEWELPYGTNPKDLDMTESHGLSAAKQQDLYLVAINHRNDEEL